MGLSSDQIEHFSKIISHSQIFHGAEESSLQELVKIASMVEVSANGFLVEEEGRVLGLYVLLEGAANVIKGGKPVFTFGRGSFFGEISLFGVSFGATATVQAREKSKFLLITREVLAQWSKKYPESERLFLRHMCTELCRRLYSTSERLK